MPEFSSEELALIERLGIKVPKPTERKVIKVQTICTLCRTITPQYFKMIRQEEDNAWVKEGEVYPTEIPKGIEIQNVQVSTCGACKEILMAKDKQALVHMLITSRTYLGLIKL